MRSNKVLNVALSIFCFAPPSGRQKSYCFNRSFEGITEEYSARAGTLSREPRVDPVTAAYAFIFDEFGRGEFD